MPQWNDPPQKLLEGALKKTWEDLADEVESNPPVEDVVGLPTEELTKHAVEAIAMITAGEQMEVKNPAILVQIYCMGFVIGTKYGESKQKKEVSEE